MVAERFERLRVVVERSALAKHQARVGRVEEVLVEGPSKRDPAMVSGRTRQNKLVHFPRPGPARRHLRHGPDHPGRAPLPGRRTGRGHRPAPAPDPHPGGGGLSRPAVRPHLALVGCTASGKSAVAMEVARGLTARAGPPSRWCRVDSMQVYRGMDIGTAKPVAAERAEVPHHLLDLVDPGEDFTVARYQRGGPGGLAGIEARGHRALLVGGTGLYFQAVVDG